jgi:hypothetical protein
MRGENINVWGFLYSFLLMRLSSKQFLFYRCKLKSHDRAVYMTWYGKREKWKLKFWYFYCIDNLPEAWFSYILSYITFLFFFLYNGQVAGFCICSNSFSCYLLWIMQFFLAYVCFFSFLCMLIVTKVKV